MTRRSTAWRRRTRTAAAALAVVALTLGLTSASSATDRTPSSPAWDDATGRLDPAAFADPPSTSRPHAFWFWNGKLTEAELERQLDEMQDNGVEEFFIHPRQGLGGEFGKTENTYYLSTDYFDKVGFVLKEARSRKMKAWLYDDLNWPSGFAGGRTVRGGDVDGRTIEADPSYVPWYLSPSATEVAGGTTYDAEVPGRSDGSDTPQPELVATLAARKSGDGACATNGEARGVRLDGASTIELTDQIKDGRLTWKAPAGDWCLVHLVQRPLENYHPDLEPDEPYVDMLNPDVTEKFIDITHETYYERFGRHFGSTIPGIFNDEPGFYNNFPDNRGGLDSRGSIPWTPGFRAYLADNAGYDLTQDLLGIWYDAGATTTKARVDYYDALSDRYNEAHTKPLADWAAEHDIALISNPLVEEDLGSHKLIEGGSWFEMSRHYQLPGMDLISGLNTSAITPKLNSSVAHLFDRKRNLAETFGAFGWDLTMEEMKRTVAWEAAGGVDLIDNHAFYYSTDGERAAESPPSQFFQNTFWPRFSQYAEMVGRLTEPARGATAMNPVGVLYPSSSIMATGTPWDVRGFAGNGSDLGPVDDSWTGTSNDLLRAQLDFDYLDELALAGDEDLGVDVKVRDGELALHKQRWQAVVLPRTTVLSLESVRTLERLVADGGTVVAVDGLATREASGRDAALQRRLTALFGTDPAAPVASAKKHRRGGLAAYLPDRSTLAEVVSARVTPGVTLGAAPDLRVRHVKRKADDAFLVVNLSGDEVRTTARFDVAGTPENWDPETGETQVAPVFRRDGDQTVVPLTMEPYEARWVTFRPGAHPKGKVAHLTATNAQAEDVTFTKGTLRTTLVADRPGEVYARGEYRGREYGAVTTVDDPLEALSLGGDWQFRFDQDGAQSVTRPLGSWTDLDRDYSGSGTYTKTFTVPDGFRADDRRLQLDLGRVRELAEVTVNGRTAGSVDWSPYTVDVTDLLRDGKNVIEVRVTNASANAVDGSAAPSGLLGPVALRPQKVVDLALTQGTQVTSLDLAVEPGSASVIPGRPARFTATVSGIAPDDLTATLSTAVPEGWTVDPATVEITEPSSGTQVRTSVDVLVTPPSDADGGTVPVTLTLAGPDGRTVARTVHVTVVHSFAAWEFEIDGETEGWSAANQIEGLAASGGALRFSSTGGDPFLVGPQVSVPLADGAVVEVEMSSTAGGGGQLFWATTDGGFAESRSGRFSVESGGTRTYRIVIPRQDASLTQLRLDPLTGTGDLVVDAIRVLPS
ncbi:glycosyl hydrolase [Mumia sp. ZJ430]|uniref:glycosylhydrolase-like jelly roll fold domain-containing protein n=1 Tax=Mumia sp. ZJ430 TaxID=2708083 RepID=UPI00142102D4|nr:glycosyl hydrolase [Mumia sp. ZJ430]